MIQTAGWWVFILLVPVGYWMSTPSLRPMIVASTSLIVLLQLATFGVASMMVLALGTFAWFQITPIRASIGSTVPSAEQALVKGAQTRGALIPVAAIGIYLFWFKYAPVLISIPWLPSTGVAPTLVPLGISYFAFRMIHYALERGRHALPRHGLDDFLAWIFLMPIFTSGPIERMDHFLDRRTTRFHSSLVVEGGTRIVQGLVKKFVIGDIVTRACDRMVGSDLTAFAHGPGGVWVAILTWAFLACALLALYLDFSAYSDIAIGASRLFGYEITENFDFPLLSTSLTEFWRRWHMSLTQWCRAYVYMPLIGLTRNPYTAILITFVVVGLWHGGSVHWLCWGLWHGLGQAVVLRWQRFAVRRRITLFRTRMGALLGWVLTMAYVSFGGVLVAFYPNGRFVDTFFLMARAFGF